MKILDKISNYLYKSSLNELPFLERKFIITLRIFAAVIKDLRNGQLSLRAMSLVYTTVISLVPLLAVSFSVLKGFGAHSQIEPMLIQAMEPLGDKGVEITEKIVGFIDNIKVGVLGAVGVGFLIFTVISMTQKIENSFNYIWRVSKGRSFAERFSDYLSVILIGPLLVVVSTGLSAAAGNNEYLDKFYSVPLFAFVIDLFSVLIPYLILSIAFAFLYSFIPNTKVSIKSALVAGLLTSVVWKLMGWGFASFVLNSANNASIYAAFATLIIFMIWLYLVWLVLLVGSSFAYYHQNPKQTLVSKFSSELSIEDVEFLALEICYLIVKDFYKNNGSNWTVESIAQKLNLPIISVSRVTDKLEEKRVLTRKIDSGAFIPARAPETILLIDVLSAIRSSNKNSISIDGRQISKQVSQFFEDTRNSVKKELEGKTLKDLLG